MLFHTWVFFIFFMIFYPGFLLLRRSRWLAAWLLLASYTFYGWWNPWYLLLLSGTTAIDYLMVILMEQSPTQRRRWLWLIISLVSNFGFLGYFKYSGFITENLNALLGAIGMACRLPDPVTYPNALLAVMGFSPEHRFASVLLPIGISFHTFQSMSYTIDAYFGHIPTERSFVRFASFVSFFPQLVAGPIERASNLLPQLNEVPTITRRDVTDGASIFLTGLFKKVALADFLSSYVDKIYSSPGGQSSPALLLATFAFAWQIYFDFSGYTDMARGIARVMGYRLMRNFNNPYVATGLGDFWNRWHISLSTWFKDYVYIPLGGNRGSAARTYSNMAITMIVSGLWHGASWTFVIWGALHAVGRVLTRELERSALYRERVPKLAKQLGVFAFVCLTWIFFRAQSVGDACLVIKGIFAGGWGDPHFPLLAAVLVGAIWVYQFVYSARTEGSRVLAWPTVRTGLAAAMVVYLLLIAQPSTKSFIYFQF